MNNRIAYVLVVFIPILGVTGVLWIRNLSDKGIQIMPYSIGLCAVLTILFFTAMFLFRKKV
ncbi:hypothetical protein [Paenibacillus sp. GCM10028914]|uniref:hypothetical protein n=1 Tax=Paenibacillus sp. GCM10028914 TaxID=3273416 RepID=UPI00361827D4